MEKTYYFDVSFDQDVDGRWSAWLTSYPACGTWGDTKDEAAEALAEMIVVFLEVMQDSGEQIRADNVEAPDTLSQVVAGAVDSDRVASIGGETIRVPITV